MRFVASGGSKKQGRDLRRNALDAERMDLTICARVRGAGGQGREQRLPTSGDSEGSGGEPVGISSSQGQPVSFHVARAGGLEGVETLKH